MLIAVFKLLKAVALLAVGIGALRLLHRDVASIADHWVNAFRVDPHNRYILMLLSKLTAVDDHRLKELSVGTFIYSAVFFTEGLGLAFRKRWAEYFTIITTGSFLPLEVYEIFHAVSVAKVRRTGGQYCCGDLSREGTAPQASSVRLPPATYTNLQSASGSGGGSPRPLKIESAKMSCDIDNFPDEK